MAALATLLLAVLCAVPARADLFNGACDNEVNLLCSGLGEGATLRCLREHQDALMTDCRRALEALRQKEEQKREAAAARALQLPPVTEALPPAPVLREVRLFGASGSVFVHLAGHPDDQAVPASSGEPLAEGDTVLVGDNGSAEVSIDSGTLVVLSTGTELELTSLSRAETELGLAVGEISADIEKLAAGENLRVRTPAAVAAVRGTELLVEQDTADGPGYVGVVGEGRVEVDAGGKAVLLGPGQETSALAGRAPEPPHPLAVLRSFAATFAAVRARAAAARRGWRPLTDAARRGERERMAARAPRARVAIVHRRFSGEAPARPMRRRVEPRRAEERGRH